MATEQQKIDWQNAERKQVLHGGVWANARKLPAKAYQDWAPEGAFAWVGDWDGIVCLVGEEQETKDPIPDPVAWGPGSFSVPSAVLQILELAKHARDNYFEGGVNGRIAAVQMADAISELDAYLRLATPLQRN